LNEPLFRIFHGRPLMGDRWYAQRTQINQASCYHCLCVAQPLGAVNLACLDFLRVRVEAGDLALARLERSQKYLTVFDRQFGNKPLAQAKRHDLTEFLT